MTTYSGTQSPETRETAWLVAVDALPSLLTVNGGPWEIIQAFDPVARRATQKTSIYVKSLDLDDQRVSNQRIRPQYQIRLECNWPVRTSTAPIAETEMQNLKNAVDLTIQRIRGPVGDKSHGGRFLSVAEVPPRITVTYADPEVTIPVGKYVACVIAYRADDYEVSG